MTRRVLTALLGWLAVVTVASTLVWFGIARVGGDVSRQSSQSPSSTVAAEEKPVAAATTTATHRPKRPSRKTAPTSPTLPPQSAPVTPVPTTSAPVVLPPTPPPTPPPSSTPKPSQAPPTTPAPPSAETRAWQGAAGLVRASCTGTRISLTGTFPSTGWHYSIGDRGPEKVEVEFERGERKAKVEARCSTGRPVFAVHTEGGGGEHDED